MLWGQPLSPDLKVQVIFCSASFEKTSLVYKQNIFSAGEDERLIVKWYICLHVVSGRPLRLELWVIFLGKQPRPAEIQKL